MDLSDVLRKHLGYDFSVTEFRSAITRNGYLLQNIKFWIWTSKREGVKRRDKVLLDLCRGSDKIRPHLVSLKKAGYKKPSLDYVSSFLSSSYDEVLTQTRKFVYKKMTFILKSFHEDAQDLVSELMAEGLRGLFLTYPMIVSSEHGIRLIKRTIHNAGINLIHTYTASKRKRLVSCASGYRNQVLSWEDYMQAKQDSEEEGESEGNETSGNMDNLHLRLSVEKIAGSLSPEKLVALQLLMGLYDKEFTAYLHEEGYLSEGETNEDMAIEDEYINLIFLFLNIGVDKKRAFLRDLRKQLA